MVIVDQVKLKFNQPQLRYITAKGKKEGVSIWGRGTGKSTIISWDIHEIVQTMPRSCWVIVGSTYKQVLTRTLPSTVAGLEALGYKLNRDYYVGRRPPPSLRWDRPLQGPLEYDHFIIFANGTGFHLVSLDAGGSASRGLNVDGFLGDEALLFDKQKLDADLSATNRGNGQYFGKNPKHHGVFLFSSMPWGDQGRWLLDKSKYYEDEGIDLVQRQNELIEAQVRFIDATSDEERLHIWREQVVKLMQDIRYFPSKAQKGTFYSEANALDNIQNLGLQYLKDQRQFMTDFTFMIEIMNRRPTTVDGGFYPMLNQAVHVQECANDDYILGLEYNLKKLSTPDSRMDSDCRSHLPLRVAVDWGGKISVLTVGQIHEDVREYRILKGMYVKHPKMVADLASDFCEYYAYQLRKEVVFLEDAEWGNNRNPNSPWTLNETFIKVLQARGWRVVRANLGRVPGHPTRYLVGQQVLAEKMHPKILRVRFNKVNTKDAVQAMLFAPVSQDSKGNISKVKSSERKESFPQEHATHFTDTIDLHLLSIGTDVVSTMPNFSNVIIMSR
ncbi:hypothetical protein [Hymenobacter crusticola]|uniref:Terminase n=1 Tax=Hymenobacter crusticola TaxID=1770526 RepID=A0A243W5V1_9BACT|nr:hypothetical protein [Hymenobacter crusticola]OUJ68663.1 hypothetical protein BXP70_27635 [Hymenobacter crusticola]